MWDYSQLNYLKYWGQKVWKEVIYFYVVDIVQEDGLHIQTQAITLLI